MLAKWLVRQKKKNLTLYIGIDPGAKGAIAFIRGNKYFVVDMPVTTTKVKKKKGDKRKNQTGFDLDAIVNLFYGIQGFRGNIVAAVERTLPNVGGGGKSAYNAFRVGMSYYMFPLFLKSKGYEVHEVHPMTWKSKMKLINKEKNASLIKARDLFRKAELHLKKHEGRAEALLIAYFIKRQKEGDNRCQLLGTKSRFRRRRVFSS